MGSLAVGLNGVINQVHHHFLEQTWRGVHHHFILTKTRLQVHIGCGKALGHEFQGGAYAQTGINGCGRVIAGGREGFHAAHQAGGAADLGVDAIELGQRRLGLQGSFFDGPTQIEGGHANHIQWLVHLVGGAGRQLAHRSQSRAVFQPPREFFR